MESKNGYAFHTQKRYEFIRIALLQSEHSDLSNPAVTVMAVATDFHRTFLTPLARISATDILLYYFYCITEKLFVKTDRKTNESGGSDSPHFSPTENTKTAP